MAGAPDCVHRRLSVPGRARGDRDTKHQWPATTVDSSPSDRDPRPERHIPARMHRPVELGQTPPAVSAPAVPGRQREPAVRRPARLVRAEPARAAPHLHEHPLGGGRDRTRPSASESTTPITASHRDRLSVFQSFAVIDRSARPCPCSHSSRLLTPKSARGPNREQPQRPGCQFGLAARPRSSPVISSEGRRRDSNPRRFRATVFKTVAFDHSATPPDRGSQYTRSGALRAGVGLAADQDGGNHHPHRQPASPAPACAVGSGSRPATPSTATRSPSISTTSR